MPKSPLATGVRNDPQRLARLSGALYLLTIPTTGAWYGISATILGGDMVTVSSLEASRSILELAILLGVIGHVNHLVLVAILYRLLNPFGKIAATLMFVFLAASVPLSFMAVAEQLNLLVLLGGANGLAIFGADQLQAQATLTIAAYMSAFNTQAVFWGVWLLPLGWLLLRSGLVPRVLAVFVLLGGPFYVMTFVGPLLDPGYSTSLGGRIFGLATGLPEVIGEVGTALWLAVMGARGRKTPPSERAAAA